MTSEYKTLFQCATDEYIVHKSRFLCHACPVQTEEAALAFLKEIRAKHKDASHHCYAYVIGENAGIMRYSDDGEPSGTAGIPIMEVIKAQEIKNCCVVITRYFGGILLGAGGLVRAYAHSASLALQCARVVTIIPSEKWLLDIPYPLYDKVLHSLQQMPVKIEQTDFGVSISAVLCIRHQDAQNVLARITQETNAKVECLLIEEYAAAWEED